MLPCHRPVPSYKHNGHAQPFLGAEARTFEAIHGGTAARPGGSLPLLCGAKDTPFLLLWKLWQGLLFQRARHALVSWECRAPSPDLPSNLDTHKSPSQASSPLPCISISLAVFHRRQQLPPQLITAIWLVRLCAPS